MRSNTDFSFRGARNYLHSTTVFDYLLKLYPDPKNVDLIIHKATSLQCRIVNQREENNDASLVASYKSHNIISYLYEIPDKISSRYACNEREILSCITISGTRAFCPGAIPNATFIEVIVAAYKALVSSLPSYGNQKLVFARIIVEYLPQNQDFIVEHTRSLGNKFFEASILLENHKIGKLIFGSR
jgi:hypothetical protein